MLNCTAKFPSGPAPYGIETSPAQAAGTYYVTYFDPGFVGGSSSSKMHYDLTANKTNTPGYTYMGKTTLSDMVNGGAVGSSGGNPSGGQIS